MKLDVPARQGPSPITRNPVAVPPTTCAPGQHSRLAGHVTTGAPSAPRVLPRSLLDMVRAALDKIASILPGAARRQGASVAAQGGRPQTHDAAEPDTDYTPTQPPQTADEQSLSDEAIRAFSDEELQSRAANLRRASETVEELKKYALGDKAKAYTAIELRQLGTLARLNVEIAARTAARTSALHPKIVEDANAHINQELDGALAEAARLAKTPGAGDGVGAQLKNTFSIADVSLRMLEEERDINLGKDQVGKVGERRLGAASLFVAAALRRLDMNDRQLLLEAMDTADLKRLAQSDPTGLAASRSTGVVIAAAKAQLARRRAGLSEAGE